MQATHPACPAHRDASFKTARPPKRSGPGLWIAFTLLATGLALAFLSNKYLPLVDLPGHASQIAVWTRYHDPAFGFQDEFYPSWFTPYLLGYALARLAATVLPAYAAVKLVLLAAAIATPLVLLLLLRESDADPWWSLLGFPVFLSFDFYWGFFNFLVAIPVGLLLVWVAVKYSRTASFRMGSLLSALSVTLFFCHAIVFGILMIAACLLILWNARGQSSCRDRQNTSPGPSPLPGREVLLTLARRLLPMAAPAAVTLIYVINLLNNPQTGQNADEPLVLTQWGWWRLSHLVGRFVSGRETDLESAGLGLGLILIFFLLARPTFTKRVELWIPAMSAFAFSILAPGNVLGTAFVFHRGGIPFFLLAPLFLRPNRARVRLALGRLWILVVSFSVLWTFRTATVRFNNEADGFDAVISALPPNTRVTDQIERTSDATPQPNVFWHFSQLALARKGSVIDWPWGNWFQMPFRTRTDFPRDDIQPDHVIVRLGAGPEVISHEALIEQETAKGFRLRVHEKGWYLFERDTPAPDSR